MKTLMLIFISIMSSQAFSEDLRCVLSHARNTSGNPFIKTLQKEFKYDKDQFQMTYKNSDNSIQFSFSSMNNGKSGEENVQSTYVSLGSASINLSTTNIGDALYLRDGKYNAECYFVESGNIYLYEDTYGRSE